MTTRREFLTELGAAAVALRASSAGPLHRLTSAPPYDLVITGGRVIDPAHGPATIADVAIKDGLIDLIAPDIPRAQALATYDASGKIVTPGLIDCHVHVFDGVATSSIDA